MTLPAINTLINLFEDSPSFQIVRKNTTNTPTPLSNSLSIDYLNVIRPKNIHVIAQAELDYINSLTKPEQLKLIEQLRESGEVVACIFSQIDTVPEIFIQQNFFSIINSDLNLTQIQKSIYFDNEIKGSNSVSIHGCFVVIYNQGILITGASGVGKSSLLLSLLNNGHMWVNDDNSSFVLNENNEIIGAAANTLGSYIHIKNIGTIDMDQAYGRARQLKQHSLTAIVELTNTENIIKNKLCEFEPLSHTEILKKTLLKWSLDKDHNNLALLLEECAKQLVLRDWGIFTSKTLENKLNQLLKQGIVSK